MLTRSQLITLTVFGAVLWLTATLYIRLLPGSLTNPIWGVISFATMPPLARLVIRLTQRVGRLSLDQLLPGIAVVGAAAMMMDGLVLHFAPKAYGADDTVVRFGAAWLLWGYGVTLGMAVLMALPGRKSGTAAHRH